MTVSSIGNVQGFAGNGTTTAFSFPFFFIAATDLAVYLTDSLGNIAPQTLNTDYTVSGTQAPNLTYPSGGTVTMTVAPPTGYSLSIIREPSQTQGTHWVDNDPDPAAVKELAFDKLTLLVQFLFWKIERCLNVQDGDVTGFFNEFPGPAVPGSVLVVDADGVSWDWAPFLAGGSSTSGTWKQEVPTGTISGSNTGFTLADTPIATATLMLFKDRLIQIQGTDYTTSGNSITMNVAPSTGQSLYAIYQH